MITDDDETILQQRVDAIVRGVVGQPISDELIRQMSAKLGADPVIKQLIAEIDDE
jgi:hypothetical protein